MSLADTPQLLHARARLRQAGRLFSRQQRRSALAFRDLYREYYDKSWRAAAREIGAEVESCGYEFLAVERDRQRTFIRNSELMIDSSLAHEIARSKTLTHKLLYHLEGYRARRFVEFDLNCFRKASHFLRNMQGSAVVKPGDGMGSGQGVTMNVTTVRELREAALLAATYSDELLMEEQIEGQSFRLLFLNGRLIHAVRRDPPSVVGDGRRTVRELIERENFCRLHDRPIRALHPIVIDLDCVLTLKSQELSLQSIPSAGEKITVKSVVNDNASDDNHVVTYLVHPQISAICSRIMHHLALKLAGIDIITGDISRPLDVTRGVVNKIKTSPHLHHHHLVALPDESCSAAAQVLDSILEDKHVQERVLFRPRKVAG